MPQSMQLLQGLRLKEKTPIQEKVQKILGTRQRATLCHTEKGVPIIIEAITEEDEKRIEKSKLYYGEIRFTKSDNTQIGQKNIYMYGEIDIDSDDDLDLIEHFNLVPVKGGYMYSNFDYEEGTVTTINKKLKIAPTFNPIKWFEYNYCLIGKPQRIIVYINQFIKIK